MKANWKNTAVIVPTYNGGKYLEELSLRLQKVCPLENIIIISDGSTDNTVEKAKSLGLWLISFEVNRGKGAVLQSGFYEASRAGFTFAFTIDCDLQHKPEDLPKFMEKQNKSEADLVIGMREFSSEIMPIHRVMSNTITSKIVSLVSGKEILDSQSGFRLYNLLKISSLKFKSERYQFETEIILKLAKLKAIIEFVSIPTIYNGQESYISNFRDIGNFIKIVIYEMINKLELENEDTFNK